jgi:hypothetical protein
MRGAVMKKRFILVLSLAFVLILSSIVFAQGTGTKETVLDKLWGMLKFLFFDFSQSGEATIITGIKFFLFILLFALLYGLSEVGPLHKMSKNIRIVLALSLSAMSVLLIPSRLVIVLASAYSAVFFGGMLAALILAAVFLIFKTFHEPTVPHRFAKAIICGIFTGVVGSFSDLTKAGGEGIGFSTMNSAALKSLSSIKDVSEFVTLIFFIMTLVYLFGAFSKLTSATPGSGKPNIWNYQKAFSDLIKKPVNVDKIIKQNDALSGAFNAIRGAAQSDLAVCRKNLIDLLEASSSMTITLEKQISSFAGGDQTKRGTALEKLDELKEKLDQFKGGIPASSSGDFMTKVPIAGKLGAEEWISLIITAGTAANRAVKAFISSIEPQ